MSEGKKSIEEVLRQEVPTKIEEDGLQRVKRPLSPAESIGTEHEAISVVQSSITSSDPFILATFQQEKRRAEVVICDVLGGYFGIASTYVKPNNSPEKSKHHPDAGEWTIDQERTEAASPALSPNLARKGTLLYEYALGGINRLTRLGHAVNIVKCVEDMERNRETHTPMRMARLGLEVGKSVTALQYKPHEAVAAGQAKARRESRAKGIKADYLSRDEWIRAQFDALMQDPGMKRIAAHAAISEMTKRGESGFKSGWKSLSPGGVETALRGRSKRQA